MQALDYVLLVLIVVCLYQAITTSVLVSENMVSVEAPGATPVATPVAAPVAAPGATPVATPVATPKKSALEKARHKLNKQLTGYNLVLDVADGNALKAVLQQPPKDGKYCLDDKIIKALHTALTVRSSNWRIYGGISIALTNEDGEALKEALKEASNNKKCLDAYSFYVKEIKEDLNID
jgi:hypothetical protein